MNIRYIIFILLLTLCSGTFAMAAQGDEDLFFYGAKSDSDMKVIPAENTFSTKGIQYGAILSPIFMYEETDSLKLGTYFLNAQV